MDKIFNNPDKEWASLVAQLVNNPPAMQETPVQSLGWEDPLEKGWLPTLVFLPGECHGQKPWNSIDRNAGRL